MSTASVCKVSLQADAEAADAIAQLAGVYIEDQPGVFRRQDGEKYLFLCQDVPSGWLASQSGWCFADASGAPPGHWHAWACAEDSLRPPASGWQAEAESEWTGAPVEAPLLVTMPSAGLSEEDDELWEQLWQAAESAIGDCHQALTHPETVRFMQAVGEAAKAMCAFSWDAVSLAARRVCSLEDAPPPHVIPKRPSLQEVAAEGELPASVEACGNCDKVGDATKERQDALSCASEVSEELEQEVTSTTFEQEATSTTAEDESAWTDVRETGASVIVHSDS